MEQLLGKTKGGSYVSKCENCSVCVVVFEVCMYHLCFFKNTTKPGFLPILDMFILGAKSWVNMWSTLGSISGPHFAHGFEGTCGPLIDPSLLLQKIVLGTFWTKEIFYSLCLVNFVCCSGFLGGGANVDHLLTQPRAKYGPLIDLQHQHKHREPYSRSPSFPPEKSV